MIKLLLSILFIQSSVYCTSNTQQTAQFQLFIIWSKSIGCNVNFFNSILHINHFIFKFKINAFNIHKNIDSQLLLFFFLLI